MSTAPPAATPTPAWPDASALNMALVAWVAIACPLVAVATRFTLPTPGYLILGFLLTSPVWLAGYALLVTAVARGMLRRRGPLRHARFRARASAWAWLTSVGVIVLGVTLVDFTDAPDASHSGLTLIFGSPPSPSLVHDVSAAIAWVAAGMWLFGYVALVVEWMLAGRWARSLQPAPARVPPPLVPRRG